MSKKMNTPLEEQFHTIIEKNREEKNVAWETLRQKLAFASAPTATNKKTCAFSLQRALSKYASAAAVGIIAICASSLVAATAISVFNTIWGQNPSGLHERFYTEQDYYLQETDINLKTYGERMGKDILYFDWYESASYRFSQTYQLRETDKIICFYEALSAPQTSATVVLQVTEKNTTLDVLNSYQSNCKQELLIQDVNVFIFADTTQSQGYWEYGPFRYYIQIQCPPSEDYIKEVIEELLAE